MKLLLHTELLLHAATPVVIAQEVFLLHTKGHWTDTGDT